MVALVITLHTGDWEPPAGIEPALLDYKTSVMSHYTMAACDFSIAHSEVVWLRNEIFLS